MIILTHSLRWEWQEGEDSHSDRCLSTFLDMSEALVQAAELLRQSFRRCQGTQFPQRGEEGGMYCEDAQGQRGDICVPIGACRSSFGVSQALVQAAELQRQSFRRRRRFQTLPEDQTR
jgi:hypothetical protein